MLGCFPSGLAKPHRSSFICWGKATSSIPLHPLLHILAIDNNFESSQPIRASKRGTLQGAVRVLPPRHALRSVRSDLHELGRSVRSLPGYDIIERSVYCARAGDRPHLGYAVRVRQQRKPAHRRLYFLLAGIRVVSFGCPSRRQLSPPWHRSSSTYLCPLSVAPSRLGAAPSVLYWDVVCRRAGRSSLRQSGAKRRRSLIAVRRGGTREEVGTVRERPS